MKLRLFAMVVLAAPAFSCGGGGSVDPLPTPTATNAPAPADICTTLGKGNINASCAASRTPQLGARVDAAIDALVAAKSGIFDLSRSTGPQQYLVIDKRAFFQGVVANLKAAGLCAEADQFNDRRVKVKTDQSYHEDYNIIDLSGYIRRSDEQSGDSYDQSCTPSAFPLDPDPDTAPPDQGCGWPYPPQISRFGVRIFLRAQDHWTLDSTPQIDNNAAYCAAVGYPDGRKRCPLRPEGHPERVPCEGWRVGIAEDTRRLGPTWRRDGKLCTGPASGCENSADNQFQLWVYEGDGKDHRYTVCREGGTDDGTDSDAQSHGCGVIVFDH